MQPLFTIHAGEYLVGSYIEENFPKYNVWVPSKDTGIDLLVTDSKNTKAVSLQVKYSKDYVPTHMKPEFRNMFRAWGWWTLKPEKIKKSKAALWIFTMQSFHQKNIDCIIIPPNELLRKLRRIHGKKTLYHTYLWVHKKNRCWETRDLKKADQILISNNSYSDEKRNFSAYLNNWKEMRKLLK